MCEYADWEFSGALEGFCGRGRKRPFHAEGPKTEKGGNQHCGKSSMTIRNGEGAKLKTATGIRGSSVSDSNTFHDLDWCAQSVYNYTDLDLCTVANMCVQLT